MHPTRRQVPPSSVSFSMQATVAPSWAARIAAVYPAGAASEDGDVNVHDPSPGSVSSAGRCYSQRREHRHGRIVLADRPEAVPLVELGLPLLGAEAHLREPVAAGAGEERLEQLGAGALAAVARDDGDRQLGCLLVDEAEPGLALAEEPVPRGAVDVASLERDDARVAAPAPVLDVAEDGLLGVAARDASGRRGGACRAGSARRGCRRDAARARARGPDPRGTPSPCAGTPRRWRRRRPGGRT